MSEIQTHKQRVNNVKGMIAQFMPQIEAVLPKRIKGEHFANVFLNVLSVTPRLAECDVPSMLGSLLKCAMLGLIPDGVTNRASLVPYKGKATFQIGYKGLKELAERHPAVRVVFPPVVVYGNDSYEFELGLAPKLVHKPCQKPDRGESIAFYCVADLGPGVPRVFEWMWRHEIETIRNATPGWKSGKETPWRSHFDRMGCKTVVKRLCSQLPSSPELAEAVALDGRAEAGLPQNLDVIDIDAEPSTPIAGEPPRTLDDVAQQGQPPQTASTASRPPEPQPGPESPAQADPGAPAGLDAAIGRESELYKKIRTAYDKLKPKQREEMRSELSFNLITDIGLRNHMDANDALIAIEAKLAEA